MMFPTQQRIELFKKTDGAMSVHEGVMLHHLASLAPEGSAVELGVHRGKGSIIAAAGFRHIPDFYLVDPCFDMENREAWAHSAQGSPEKAHQFFKDFGFREGVIFRVTCPTIKAVHLMGDYSTHAIPLIPAPIAYCLIDSDVHGYELCRDELSLLKDRMAIGGIIAMHDWGACEGVERAYREFLQNGMYTEIPLDWETVQEFVSDNGGESGNSSWHMCGNPMPMFLAALRRVK